MDDVSTQDVRVLLVEDNPVRIALLRRVLEADSRFQLRVIQPISIHHHAYPGVESYRPELLLLGLERLENLTIGLLRAAHPGVRTIGYAPPAWGGRGALADVGIRTVLEWPPALEEILAALSGPRDGHRTPRLEQALARMQAGSSRIAQQLKHLQPGGPAAPDPAPARPHAGSEAILPGRAEGPLPVAPGSPAPPPLLQGAEVPDTVTWSSDASPPPVLGTGTDRGVSVPAGSDAGLLPTLARAVPPPSLDAAALPPPRRPPEESFPPASSSMPSLSPAGPFAEPQPRPTPPRQEGSGDSVLRRRLQQDPRPAARPAPAPRPVLPPLQASRPASPPHQALPVKAPPSTLASGGQFPRAEPSTLPAPRVSPSALPPLVPYAGPDRRIPAPSFPVDVSIASAAEHAAAALAAATAAEHAAVVAEHAAAAVREVAAAPGVSEERGTRSWRVPRPAPGATPGYHRPIRVVPVRRSDPDQGLILAVYGPKGGTGCSSLAINLAVAIRGLGATVAVVDGHRSFGSVDVLLQLDRAGPTVQTLADEDAITPHLVLDALRHHASGVHALLAPPEPEQAERIVPGMYLQMLDALCRHFICTIVDLPADYDPCTMAMLQRADRILLPTAPDLPAMKSLDRFLAYAQYLQGVSERLDPVLIRANSVPEHQVADLEADLGLRFTLRVISDGRRATQAANRGIPFVVSAPDAPITKDVQRVAAWIYHSFLEGRARVLWSALGGPRAGKR